ncbi:MAG: glycosyltransferase [Bacilli bacterium]
MNKILNIIAISLFVIYVFGFILTILTIFLEKKYIKKLGRIKIKKYKDIYVLLPALKEQKIVKSTIDWFSKYKYKGKIKFIIITSEKEDNEYKLNKVKEQTTNTVVDKYLKQIKDNRFIHLHYPKTNGNKSSQMNYAIDYINEYLKPNLENTYISVFDFDSKPELDTFEKVNVVAEFKNNPDVIGQVPLCLKNYEDLSQKTSNVMLVLYTLQHIIRSCAVEKFKLLFCSLTNHTIPQYCMGACMHLKLNTLIENDKFPFFVDDLTLGFRLSIKNAKFSYLPSYNYTLIYNDLYSYMNSATLIFKGTLTFFSEIKNISNKYIFGKIKMLIIGLGNLSVFTIFPYFIFGYYIYSIVIFKFSMGFWLLLSIPYLWCIASYIIIKINNFKKDNKLNVLLAFLISPIWFIFRPSGFIIYLKRLIVSKFTKKDIVYKKTER